MNNSFEYSGHDNLEIMSLAKKYNQTIFDWLSQGQSSSHRVLDFGSGHGEFFFRFVEQDYPTTAVELDESVHSIYPDGQVFADLAMAEGPFELVYSVNVLEHIEDESIVLKEIREKIQAVNGRVKIFVPARQELYSSMDEKVGHYRRYSRRQLIDLFEENGFVVTSCRYFDFIGYFASLVYKFIASSGDISAGGLVTYDRYIFPVSRLLDRLFQRVIGKNLILEAYSE